MSRIDDIVEQVRDSLADPQGDRWDDFQLLRFINEAQKKVAIKAKLIRKTTTGTIVSGTAECTAPTDCYLITRLSINNEKVPTLTYEELDNDEDAWEDDTGATVEGVVFDESDAVKFSFYPIPTDPTYIEYKLRYVAYPTTLVKLSDSLEISQLFDEALKHYTVATAWRLDQDTQSKANAIDEFALFNTELVEAIKLNSLNGNTNSTRTTTYRGFE